MGAASSGLISGMRMADQDKRLAAQEQRQEEDQSFQNEQRGRARKQWADQDKTKVAMDDANKAARDAYEAEMGPQGLGSGLPPSGQDDAGPEAPNLSAGMGKVGGNQGIAVVKALEARTGHILKTLGPGQEWASAWSHEADARDQLRGSSMDSAYAKYKTDGNPLHLVSGTYPWVNDGWDLGDAKTVIGADGRPVVQATRVNRKTGETESKTINGEQALKMYTFFRDPTNARKVEVQAAIDAAKSERELDGKIQVVRESGDQDRQTEVLRQKGRLKEIELKPPVYSQPQVAMNPETGQMEYVRFPNQGAPQFTGVRPAPKEDKLQPIPAAAMTAITENRAALSKIDEAMSLIDGNPGALGLQNYLGDTIQQHVDPAGVKVRAAISDLGSLKMHDRSGAAVSVSEMARLKPFIPSATDSPETVKKKLEGFRNEYATVLADLQDAYRPENGYRANSMVKGPVRTPSEGVMKAPRSAEDAIAQARDAIAKGAPKDAVLKRLEAAGIKNHGL